jgi:tetratricopeptide (TPR) repeat protein
MNNSSTKTSPTSDASKDSSKSRSEEPYSATLREARMLGSYGHYDEADPLFQKALEQTKLAKSNAKRPGMARTNVLTAYGDFLIASAQNGKGTWLQARKVYSESASLYPNEHNFQRLGMIDYQLNDYPKAEEDYAKALADFDGKFKRKDGSLGENYPLSDRSNQVELANILIEQGNTFMKEQKYSQARSAFLRASKVLESPDDRILAAEALKGVAQTFDKEGNFTQADQSYKQAQELLSRLSHAYAQPALVSVLKSRIQVLQKLGHEQEVTQLQKQLAELRP